MLRSGGALLSLSILATLAACGARSALTGPVESTGVGGSTGIGGSAGSGGSTSVGGSAGSGGSTGVGGSAGSGGSGGGLPCTKLVWAGEPVILPPTVGDHVRRPRLARTSLDDLALIAEATTAGEILLASTAITGWTVSWPPSVSPLVAAHSHGLPWSGYAYDRGPPGAFSLLWVDTDAHLVLGIAEPGGAVDGTLSFPGALGAPRFVARNNGGRYLIGHGPPGALVVHHVPDFFPGVSATPLGVLGCADDRVVSDAVGVGDDRFLVVSTNHAPFDDCLDPSLPGPPRVVQITRAGPLGIDQGSYFEEPGPVFDVQIAGRIGGAWMAYRAQGDAAFHIHRLDNLGYIDASYGVLGDAGYSDAVIAWGDGFAHVMTHPGDAAVSPQVSFYVREGDTIAELQGAVATPLFPRGRPSLVSSTDGRSFLITFEQGGPDQDGSLALLRADCVD